MNTTTRTVSKEAPAVSAGFREILVPTDLSDHSDAALEQAAILAGRLGGQLTLYHALEFPDHEYGHWAFGERPSVWDEKERLARDHLADCVAALAVPHETVLERAASPVRALLDRIGATAPDLTVMSTLGRGALSHALLGSVAEQVVDHTRCPVLCVRGTSSLDRGLRGRIVLDTDCSEAALPALHLARLLARAFGGELIVVWSATPEPGHVGGGEPWRPYAAVERWLAPPAPDLTVRVVLDAAPPLKAVPRIASDERAGLVVTYRRPYQGGADADAVRLVRHAHCPVLVV